MIDSIYIDNYKCFSNFQYEPSSVELILGDNGSGKTTVFDVIRKLKEFVTQGTSSVELFPSHELTAWDSRSEQRFEIGLEGNGGRYVYTLQLEHEHLGMVFERPQGLDENHPEVFELLLELYKVDPRDWGAK